MLPPLETPKPEGEDERLRSLIANLQSESGILERIVYKNKNQHRRCPYFQHLLKVRRDVRLLQSSGLEEILHALFPVIQGRRPPQIDYLPQTRVKKKCPIAKHNYEERLLGIARLLSQMAEPILKAAIQISFLLAKSFFAGFSLTVLALLARLRVLVQQILLDTVSVFNKISSLARKKRAVKLNTEGITAFREFYPVSQGVITLECVWEGDKFVLLERTNTSNIKSQDEDNGALPLETSIQYETVELFNEAQSPTDDFGSEKMHNGRSAQDSRSSVGEPSVSLPVAESATLGTVATIVDCEDEERNLVSASEERLGVSSVHSPWSLDLRADSRKKKVAFVPVTKLRASDINIDGPCKKMKLDASVTDAMKTDNPCISLLSGSQNLF